MTKISKELHVTKWTEEFKDYAHIVIGVRTVPLAYRILYDVTFPDTAPTLASNQS